MLLKTYRMVSLCIASSFLVAPALGQDDKKQDDKKKDKPYDEVITEDAVTDPGLFTVHTVGDTLYYEIVPDAFGDDLLWVTQLAKTQAGHSFAGMPVGDRVVRWERRGDNVLTLEVGLSEQTKQRP